MRHDLKIWPRPFAAIMGGIKRYEIRKNDRNFQLGDELFLREWNPQTEKYSGAYILATVSYMSQGEEWGLPEDICVMSLQIQYWNTEAKA